jgi:putative transcriptional regulator
MDNEMAQFQADLLESVRQMKAGQAARITEASPSNVAAIRLASNLSQARFADLMGISVRTLQDWEQGRRSPSGAAMTLLRVAERHPEVLREVASP